MKSPLALALLLALGASGNAAGAAAPDQMVRAPHIGFRLRVLPNGLKLYSLVDRSTHNVAVQVWYGVGSKNDPPGRSGMAHLCEHMMFKGSRHLPPDFIDRLTDDVGGESDASTAPDNTEYDEVAPAGQLERMLWAEAQRMASLDVDQADFAAERRVVEQELRQDALDDPYQALFEVEAPRASFVRAAYRQSVIGSIGDLEAATSRDVSAFHSLYYRPDNASLVVVGDFDPGQLDRWVDAYFGALARPQTPIPRADADEPLRTTPRVVEIHARDAPQPALMLTYAAPPAASRDAAALKVLDAVLTLGETSRLSVDLVAKRRVAERVFSAADLWQHAGLVEVGATLAGGVSMARGEAALRGELARVRRGAVTESEVRAAKNQLLASLLQDRETIDGVAYAIGEASILEGDASHVNTDPLALSAVTAADVRHAAETYLVDQRRVTIRYHPGGPPATTAAPSLARPAAGEARDAVLAPPDEPAALPAEDVALPPAGPTSPPIVASVREQTLTNGLRVIVARTGAQPIATAMLSFRGGSAHDPAGKPGLAYLTAVLSLRGRDVHAQLERARRIALLGDTLATETDYDSTSFHLTGLAASLPEGLASLAQMVRTPPVGEGELRSLRGQLHQEMRAPDVDAQDVSDAAVNQLAFGEGPYGHLANGAPIGPAGIREADVAREAARLYRPDNAVLVVTGGVEPDAVFALVRQAFGKWPKTPSAPLTAPLVGTPRRGEVVVIDVPGLKEATVTVAVRSVERASPSYEAVEVANAVLGGGQSSRMSEDIRERRGLTYDASSELDGYGGVSLFTARAQVENATAPELATLFVSQLRALAQTAPSPGELAARKADLVGEFYRDAATSDGLADLLTANALDGGDTDEIGRYGARIQAVSAGEVQAAAARLADPAGVNVVVVGDAAQFMAELRARFPQARLLRPVGLQSVHALAR